MNLEQITYDFRDEIWVNAFSSDEAYPMWERQELPDAMMPVVAAHLMKSDQVFDQWMANELNAMWEAHQEDQDYLYEKEEDA